MKTFRYIAILLGITLVNGCEVLDVEPTQSIPSNTAITNRLGVERALNGCYDALQLTGYYGRNFLVVPDLASDNLDWTGTTAGYNQIANNSVLSDNVIIESIWSNIYTANNRVNYIIEALPKISDLTTEQRNQYEGEAHFLRALHHFNLAIMFGGVPIRTKPVTLTPADLNVPRNTREQVFDQVLADLRIAEVKLPATIRQFRASKAAALALSARVYLYRYGYTNEMKYVDSAMVKANRVLSEFGLQLDPSYRGIFAESNSPEIIFAVDFNAQDRNRLAEYFFTRTLSGRKEFSPPASMLNAYTAADTIRKNASIRVASDGPYCFKYSDISNGTDDVIVIRLAEMYLIMAECETIKNGNRAAIRFYINTIRQRAGLSPVTADDYNMLALIIENERRLEFAFEGHRWFDLVRTRRAIAVLPLVTQECQYLFPIPLSEIQANNAITPADQNPCY